MKLSMKKLVQLISITTMVACFFCMNPVYASSGVWSGEKKAFFEQANKSLRDAQLSNAEFYAPDAFNEGSNYYKNAEKYFDKGNRKASGKKIKKAFGFLSRSAETAGHAVAFFKKQAVARKNANNVDAVKYENDKWNEAEKLFKSAIIRYEKGDLAKARKYAGQAEGIYQAAELGTIETSYLRSVRTEIKVIKALGKRNNAKKTFAKAEKLVQQVEVELAKQRYSNSNASELAKEAAYEISHAKYIHHHIRQMKESDYEFEDLQLEAENSIHKIAKELGIKAEFDKGFKNVDRILVAKIKKLKIKINQDSQKITALNHTIAGLESQVSVMNNTEGMLKKARFKAEKALRRQKQKQLVKKKTIKSIRASFAHDEGKVLMDGDNIIIRLYGLNFPVGKAVIQPEYFGLLSKVRRSFNKFKQCQVVIEGHTDSIGRDALNQRLSEERADAVRQYILANASIHTARISSIGYGESKPVASNETKAGQAKNRRIDVVIIPAAR